MPPATSITSSVPRYDGADESVSRPFAGPTFSPRPQLLNPLSLELCSEMGRERKTAAGLLDLFQRRDNTRRGLVRKKKVLLFTNQPGLYTCDHTRCKGDLCVQARNLPALASKAREDIPLSSESEVRPPGSRPVSPAMGPRRVVDCSDGLRTSHKISSFSLRETMNVSSTITFFGPRVWHTRDSPVMDRSSHQPQNSFDAEFLAVKESHEHFAVAGDASSPLDSQT